MLKAEGKELNKSITFCLFCCHFSYECTINHNTSTNRNLNIITNPKQTSDRFLKICKIRYKQVNNTEKNLHTDE